MHYLGLDISKDTVDTYSDACGHLKIENTIQGIQTLLAHLQTNGLNQENMMPRTKIHPLFPR